MSARLRRSSPRRRRRGFTTLLAIALLLLIAVILPALGAVFTADARRTRTQAQDAQLRQLLTAGAVYAANQAGSPSAATTQATVPLPTEIAYEASVAVLFSPPSGENHRTATVRVTLNHRTMAQVVEFDRGEGGRWQAVAATLNSPPPAPADVR